MDTNLPKDFKPLALIGVLLVLTLSVGFLPAKWFGIKVPETSYSNHIRIDLSQITDPNNLATDSDKDGVITWKELVAQNAEYSSTTIAEAKAGATPDPKVIERLNDPNNLTASFSKNLYLAGLYLKKNNLTDADSYQQALNQIISQEASKIAPTAYSYKDIRIAPTETKESIKIYGNTIAPILQSALTRKIMVDNLSAINSYAEAKDQESLDLLAGNKVVAETALQKLLNVSVPPSALSHHILMLNRISAYRDTLENISKIEVDPLRAAISTEKYSNTVTMILFLYNQYTEYFNIKNVVFSSKDPGYAFTTGYTIQ